jgi:hypothetical protein
MASGASWEPLGRVSPGALGSARLTLHWAAQIVAAVGSTLIEARPDWSQTALGWIDSAPRGLAGEPLPGGARAFLATDELSLAVLGADGRASDRFSLAERTLADGLVWLAGAVARVVGGPERPLARPVHELPPSPVGDGAPFEIESEALAELSSWYANASRLLAEVAKTPGASPVRCWPHHFDIATLIHLDGTSGEEARSIGVGLSPGDGSYAEPYWYVTPWPYPKEKQVPSLALGHWHTTGWFGAVLTASEMESGDPGSQPANTRCFVEAAMTAARELVRIG